MAIRTARRIKAQKMSGDRVFSETWSCELCHAEVDHDDKYCNGCGVMFSGNA